MNERDSRLLSCLHVISGLGTGGAEMMLRKLVLGTQGRTLNNEVVSLGTLGTIGEELAAAGVPVVALGMGAGGSNGRAVLRLVRHMRASRPDVVQAWMYHANLIGGFAARLAGAPPTIWNIRTCNLAAGGEKASTRMAARLSGRLARPLARRIVTNAHAARDVHVEYGYPADLFQVIPNGFETTRFRPDPEARAAVRRELGVPDTAPLVGLLARRHPVKDHPGFLEAAARIRQALPDAHFLLAGQGVTLDDEELREAVERGGLTGRAHLLGHRTDTPRLLASMDVYVSASWYGEAFPNVLGEAMACGVPCVATDLGDSALIIAGHGRLVEPRDPAAMAGACLEILRMPQEERRRLSAAARDHIQRHYSIEAVAAAYENIYTEMRRVDQHPE
ncbi:MAG TPA: glycosyltransferase [Longimicrobium sp.]